ncbi:FAD-dependent oxidoreductase, partial [Corallococcus sp. ZKHCc1 1396]
MTTTTNGASSTATATLSASTILQHMSVPGEPNIYVLGCFEGRVTIHSQQIRALNLIYALCETGALHTGSKIAVVGGGVAGLTAALGAANRLADVTIFEKRQEFLHLQRGCLTRWIHPNIYDWPSTEASQPKTSLPFLNWTAGSAGQVAQQIIRNWDESKTPYLIKEEKGTSVTLGPSQSGRRSLFVTAPQFRSEDYDIIILAVGFGLERTIPPQPLHSYWRDNSLHQPEAGWTTQPTRYLVSGNGDGGLIDLLRLRLRDFRHESIADELARAADLSKLSKDLIEIETTVWNMHARGDEISGYLYQRYSKLTIPSGVDELIKNRLRRDTHVTFNFTDWPLTIFSSVLNRFIAFRLITIDERVESLVGRVISFEGQEPNIVAKIEGHTGVRRLEFNRIVLRHGPSSSLASDFPLLNERIAPVLRARNALDQTRHKAWPDNYFESTTQPIDTPPEPKGSQDSTSPAHPANPSPSQTENPQADQPTKPQQSPTTTPPPAHETIDKEARLMTIGKEARLMRNQVIEGRTEALNNKLALLNPIEHNFLLKEVSERALQDDGVMRSFGTLISSKSIDHTLILLNLNRTVRMAAFSASVEIKSRVLEFPTDLLKELEPEILVAFFEDIFDIIDRDRFGDVNTIVPRLENAHAAVPAQLYERYFRVLLEQSRSASYHGAPAAKRALLRLSPEMAKAALNSLTPDLLIRPGYSDALKRLITTHRTLANPETELLLKDFLGLSHSDFVSKYIADDSEPDDWDPPDDSEPDDSEPDDSEPDDS